MLSRRFAFLLPALSLALRSKPADDLSGTWEVDLRPTPDAAPYLRPMVLKVSEDNRVSGYFYGNENLLRWGFVQTNWGEPRIAFITGSRDEEYYHSAKLVNGKLEGLSHCPKRNLLSVWFAVRKSA